MQSQVLHCNGKGGDSTRQQTKYHNVPTTKAGIKFASKKEAERYQELMLMVKAGEISDLRLQPQYTLVEGFTTPDGQKVQPMRYVADFSYWRGGVLVVEDVKSPATKTRVYELKKKLLLDKYGIQIQEV